MKTFDELFEEYVPNQGKADTLAGELLRAYNKIAYAYYSDGTMIGDKVCNSPSKFLSDWGNEPIRNTIQTMYNEKIGYEGNLQFLEYATIKYIENNPLLTEIANERDMLNYV